MSETGNRHRIGAPEMYELSQEVIDDALVVGGFVRRNCDEREWAMVVGIGHFMPPKPERFRHSNHHGETG